MPDLRRAAPTGARRPRAALRSAWLPIVAVAATGCPDRAVTAVDPATSAEQYQAIPITVSRELDLLFVIDNSPSMEDEQRSLAENFPRFMSVLERIEGGLPDVHIGVVSSDLGIGDNERQNCGGEGDRGDLLTNGCANLAAEPYIVDVRDEAGGRRRNYAGTLVESFECMAKLGVGGCGMERHLEAMRVALDGNPRNAGFLRDEAWLAVIIIADEDDCSASDPDALFDTSAEQDRIDSELGFFDSYRCWEFGVECQPDQPRPLPADGREVARQACVPRDDSPYVTRIDEYVDFLRGLKADPRRVIVAGIVGDPEPVKVGLVERDDVLRPSLLPSCSGGSGEAAPATRLAAFLDGFPERSIRESICQDDLSGALDDIARLFAQIIGDFCLAGELFDADLTTDGVQPDCRVSELVHLDTPAQTERSIAPCAIAGATRPCYTIAPAERCTGQPTGLALEIDRGGEAPPADATIVARCRVE